MGRGKSNYVFIIFISWYFKKGFWLKIFKIRILESFHRRSWMLRSNYIHQLRWYSDRGSSIQRWYHKCWRFMRERHLFLLLQKRRWSSKSSGRFMRCSWIQRDRLLWQLRLQLGIQLRSHWRCHLYSKGRRYRLWKCPWVLHDVWWHWFYNWRIWCRFRDRHVRVWRW